MADELDPRLEQQLRDALHHEADALPFLVRAEDIDRARRARSRRRLAIPASLLAAAAVVVVVVATVVFGRFGNGDIAATPSASVAATEVRLVGYEMLTAMLGVTKADLQGEHPVADPAGTPVTVELGTVSAPATVGYAIDCLGGHVTLTFDDGAGNPSTMQADCATQPYTAMAPGSQDPYRVSVTADPAVRWRIVMVAVAAPSPAPFHLATYEELEASLAESSIMPVILRGEHPVAETGTESVTTDLGPVGNVGFEDFAYSCTGGSIKIDKVAGDIVLNGMGTECSDNIELYTDATDTVDPAAHIVVTASPQVIWRVMISGAPTPSQEPTPEPPTATPSLPPVGTGETGLISMDITAADGSITREAVQPAGVDKYLLHASCAGSGTLELNIDGVDGYWDCGAIGTETFAPSGVGNGVYVVATVTGEARFLLRLDGVDLAATPGVTFVPPALAVQGDPVDTGGHSAVTAFAGCGLRWTPKAGGGYADECGPSWQAVPDHLVQKPGTFISISLADGWTITKVEGAVARNNAVVITHGAPAEQPWTGAASGDTWTFPAPPLGFWGVRLTVTATKDGDTFQVPYYAAVYVTQ